jgi:antitoxin (DNA-binding transcriptional repressor) of toxin-antitoxin stability system
MSIIDNLPESDGKKRQLVARLVSGKNVVVKKADGSYVRIVPLRDRAANAAKK